MTGEKQAIHNTISCKESIQTIEQEDDKQTNKGHIKPPNICMLSKVSWPRGAWHANCLFWALKEKQPSKWHPIILVTWTSVSCEVDQTQENQFATQPTFACVSLWHHRAQCQNKRGAWECKGPCLPQTLLWIYERGVWCHESSYQFTITHLPFSFFSYGCSLSLFMFVSLRREQGLGSSWRTDRTSVEGQWSGANGAHSLPFHFL